MILTQSNLLLMTNRVSNFASISFQHILRDNFIPLVTSTDIYLTCTFSQHIFRNNFISHTTIVSVLLVVQSSSYFYSLDPASILYITIRDQDKVVKLENISCSIYLHRKKK